MDSVELFKDGTWKVSAETAKKSTNVVDLTLDDEEVEISFVSESMAKNKKLFFFVFIFLFSFPHFCRQ